ncbi:MAG: two-component system response regulator [Deltaproteobacteria bacterium RIFOXYA12_FULL_58_15]|nr:MAG: two-component system response regulator [Deltaproteobacteria bacterium RIFOXYA12_FULL_58_15]OGR13243.1 MAG: two-component system response regulator [Deltaproteobacteria bacterium RIFOXYB12_FULL_58_9]
MDTKATVLVIDDEPGMRDMLAWELTQEGFDVATAESGMAAVEAMKKRKFDLAVTDLKMPGMDGVATIEALRALDPDIEVIVGTGYASVETAIACMKGGAYDYIQKPYDLNELRLLLERAMEKSHLQGVVALYEASRVLLATLNHPNLVQLVLSLAQKVLRADDTALLLSESDTTRCVVHGLTGDTADVEAWVSDLTRDTLHGGTPLCVPSSAMPEIPAALVERGYVSALIYPLTARRRALGSLVVFRRTGSVAFVLSELQKGMVFAHQIALSLDNARLYDELEAKIGELVATREQLVQAEKMGLAGRLAEVVSHEINNPLAAVRGSLEALRDYSTTVGALWLATKSAALYLQEQSCPIAGEHARGLLSIVGTRGHTEGMVHDIAEVIDDTLDGVERIADLVSGFSRLAKTSGVAPSEVIDVNDLVKECLRAPPTESEHPIRTTFCANPQQCRTVACREDVKNALLNVLDYLRTVGPGRGTPAAGISLCVSVQEGRPCVLISDESLVIPIDERRRIFDPHVEIDTRRGRTMRMNISLALAQQMLACSGAEISVDTQNDEGVHFRIRFPAEERLE